MRPSRFFLISALVLSFSSQSHANELKGMLKNNEGVVKFMDKRPAESFDAFTDALAEVPFSGAVHFNLGTAFLANKEIDKAVSEYKAAIELSRTNSAYDREIRFRSLFNVGVALTEQKKIDEALEAYQAALSVKPDSVETKHNIELLTKMDQGGGEGEDQQQNQDQGENKDKKDGQGKEQDDKKDPKDDQQQQE